MYASFEGREKNSYSYDDIEDRWKDRRRKVPRGSKMIEKAMGKTNRANIRSRGEEEPNLHVRAIIVACGYSLDSSLIKTACQLSYVTPLCSKVDAPPVTSHHLSKNLAFFGKKQ